MSLFYFTNAALRTIFKRFARLTFGNVPKVSKKTFQMQTDWTVVSNRIAYHLTSAPPAAGPATVRSCWLLRIRGASGVHLVCILVGIKYLSFSQRNNYTRKNLSPNHLAMIIIGICGTLWAGKWTVVDFLVKKHWFLYLSMTEFLREKCREQNLPLNRDSYIYMATHLRTTYGNGYMAEQLYDRAQASWKNVVIESLMAVGEVEAMRSKWWTFYLFAVDADITIRYKRIVSRGGEKDNVSFEEFEHHEKIEMDNEDPNKQNIAKCMKLADHVFNNDGTLEELNKQIEDVITKLKI